MRALFRPWPAAMILALLALSPVRGAAQAPAGDAPAPRVSSVFTQMRHEALTIAPDALEFDGRPPRVWGAVMDVGLPSGEVTTIVVFADGTTSLFSSNGSGIVGAGAQRAVRRASDEFLDAARGSSHALANAAADTFPLPAAGRVRFHLRTSGGVRTAEAGEDELTAGGHALGALYAAGRVVLRQVKPLSQYDNP
jgi:hypothetical protein